MEEEPNDQNETQLPQILRLFFQESVEKSVVKDFVEELRIRNPFFKRLSVFTCLQLLKSCEVVVFNNEIVYKKGEETQSALVILYGRIALYLKEVGVFYETEKGGDTLCEENLLFEEKSRRYSQNLKENPQVFLRSRLETAKVKGELAAIEIGKEQMIQLKGVLEESESFRDYDIIVTILRNNFYKKKTFRSINIETHF